MPVTPCCKPSSTTSSTEPAPSQDCLIGLPRLSEFAPTCWVARSGEPTHSRPGRRATMNAVFDLERVPRATREECRVEPPSKLAPREVRWSQFDPSHIQRLEEVLAPAEDERPLQRFLADHPHILIAGIFGQVRREAWVFDRPRFGADYIPDFLIGMIDSLGFVWTLVELENPTVAPLTKSGQIGNPLHKAVAQIRDWREWLRTNALNFQERSGCRGITADCAASVVIGRREMRDHEEGKRRIRDFRREHIEVMSYDRLLETARDQSDWLVSEDSRLSTLPVADTR